MKIPQIKIRRTKRSYKVWVDNKIAKRIACSSRTIYKYNDYIIKIDDCDILSENQSAREARTWESIQKKDRKYFAPLITYGISFTDEHNTVVYSVQQYIKYSLEKNKKCSDEVFEKMYDICEKYDIGDIFSEDRNYKNPNWVLTKKGPVVLDYGY